MITIKIYSINNVKIVQKPHSFKSYHVFYRELPGFMGLPIDIFPTITRITYYFMHSECMEIQGVDNEQDPKNRCGCFSGFDP